MPEGPYHIMRGLDSFVDGHQLPFRIAFPRRKGGQQYVRTGDGHFSATGGRPGVTATQRTPAASGQPAQPWWPGRTSRCRYCKRPRRGNEG